MPEPSARRVPLAVFPALALVAPDDLAAQGVLLEQPRELVLLEIPADWSQELSRLSCPDWAGNMET
jgi:hypothetical protein